MQIIATLIPAHPNLEQMFMFSAVGFLVVIFVLMFLSYMTSFIGMFFAMKERKAPSSRRTMLRPNINKLSLLEIIRHFL